MDLEIKKYSRKPFDVDAVQVTAENIHTVAKWCKGEVLKTTPRDPSRAAFYIQANVIRAQNDRQTRAFVGDWVLCTNSGFKVYGNKAFEEAFEFHIPETALESETQMALYTNSGSGANWMMTPEQQDALQFVTAVAKAVKEVAAS